MSTMKDPVRLVLDPSCPEGQRQLLRHGTSLEPPREAESVVWQALVGTLGAAAVGGAVDAPGKTTTSSATGATKATGATTTTLVAVVLALGALTAAVALGTHLVSAPKPPPPAAVVEPPPAPHAPTGAPALLPQPTTGAKSPWADALPPETSPAPPAAGAAKSVRAKRQPAAAATTSAGAPSPATPAREESTLFEEARQALRSGDPARALKLLEECRRRFPVGVLEQEREVLTIQALVSAVRGREARTRAAAFLRKHPGSPHAGEIRALGLGAPDGR